MKKSATLSVLAIGLYVLGGWAGAADQTILGRSFIVRNPGAADKRKVTSVAKEEASPNTVTGDPTVAGSAGGAILTVIANGANPTTQTFNLPQNSTPSGKPFWRVSGTNAFKYKDAKGVNGAVKSVTIKKTPGGTFSIKIQIRGKNGPLNVVPPNPGTDGFFTLKIGGGDLYCVKFGVDGTVINKNGTLFKVRRPVIEGCPGGPTSTTTTTSATPTTTSSTIVPPTTTTSTPSSSTTTTTIYSSPSRAFLDTPIDLLD